MKTFSLYDIESILNIDTDTVKITFEHVKKLVEIQKNCWLNKYTQKEVENLSTREKLDLKENISDDFFSENDVTCLEEYKLAEYANTTLELLKIEDTDNRPEFSRYVKVYVLGFSKFPEE